MDDNHLNDEGGATPNPITNTTKPVSGAAQPAAAPSPVRPTATAPAPAKTVTTANATPAPASTPAPTPTAAIATTPTTSSASTVSSDEPTAEPATEPTAELKPDLYTEPTIEPTKPANPKKNRTGLIAGIISAAVVLILGICFAAFAMIKNQPDNIAAESFANLLNAKQVAVSGELSLSPKGDTLSTMGPIKITLDSKTADSNQSMNTNITVSLPEQNKIFELGLGEVMLNNGVFYIKASGLTEIYQEFLQSLVDTYLQSMISQNLTASTFEVCYDIEDFDEYSECMNRFDADDIINASKNMLNQDVTAKIKAEIAKIITKVDDQWFEISIKDILESDLVSQYIDETTKESILKSYDCAVDMLNKKSDYSNEFSNLYMDNKFIKVTPADDSYYKVAFDEEKMANYLNALPDTKVVSDFANCSNVNLGSNDKAVSAEKLGNITKNLPGIYAKFDGFLSHNLTALKVEQKTDYYEMMSNLDIAYPTNLTVSRPADSRPIMDLVQEVMTEIESLSQELLAI
ncbi:hypothetical protein J5491_00095 [Candidatus Saccharibacteria bacterium]|nr:hypothetical protein [Candidatus Saccharibacteria bacterium]